MFASFVFALAVQSAPPQIDLAKVKSNTPAYAVSGYLAGWQKNDRAAMKKFLQLSGRQPDAMANMSLDNYLKVKIVGAKVDKTVPVTGMGDMLADVYATVWTSAAKTQKWKFRVVRESKPQTPSPTGVWGVNAFASNVG